MAIKTKAPKIQKSSLSKRNIQKFCQNKLAVVGLIGLVIYVLACAFAPLITPWDPLKITPSMRNLPISWEHWLGTDRMGRDLFARILYGGRYSMLIGFSTSILVSLMGVILGCIAGYFGRWIDTTLVSVQEFFSIFPGILCMMLARSIFGASILTMILTWTIIGWGGMMRTVRAKVMSLRNEPFVESCRANGISGSSIMFKHMIPNTMGPIIIAIVSGTGSYMTSEAGLAYLGLGVPSNIPTWGNIINAAKSLQVIQATPILWLAPGIIMCIFLLCINSVGNGLRDALDPTSR